MNESVNVKVISQGGETHSAGTGGMVSVTLLFAGSTLFAMARALFYTHTPDISMNCQQSKEDEGRTKDGWFSSMENTLRIRWMRDDLEWDAGKRRTGRRMCCSK
jgi:hypothetical protein